MAIAFFIQATAIGAQAFLIREYRGVGTALLGNLSIAVGFLLTLFRDDLPAFLTIIIANVLIITGPNLYYIAVSRFTGQKYSTAFIISNLLATTALLVYFRFVRDNINVRIIVMSLIGSLCVSVIAYKFWKARHAAYRFGMALTVVPFVIYGIFLVIRSAATIISPPNELFSNTPVESATYLLLFLISFLWTIGFILMVSQRLQIDLTELATIDSLTGISNRRATQAFFEKELSRVNRYGGGFSILLSDLDRFKQVNDKYGHTAGDLVLVKAAWIFQAAIRKQDLAGRWGGEEFLFILPSTPLEDAQILAERLRKEISSTDFRDGKDSIRVTISIGVAHSHGSETMDTILKKADDALFAAKTTKDAVVTAS